MPVSRLMGPVTVVALEDGRGTFFMPRSEAFPTAGEADWRRADHADPDAVTEDGQWMLRFRCFAIRLDSGETVLVDTGIGPADAPAARWAPVPGNLPGELAAAGIAPQTVTAVVLTHLHTDHIGWAVTDERPFFPDARYVLQQAEYDAAESFSPALPERLFAPLKQTGQLHLVEGTEKLGPGLSTVHTPGHTPGHQCVVLDVGGETLAVTGDLLVHAIQLTNPEIGYALEHDQALARESRVALLERLARARGVLATAHLSEPFRPL